MDFQRDIPPAGGAILFRTTNSTSGRIMSEEFFRDGAHLSAEAARMCVDRAGGGVRAVGQPKIGPRPGMALG